VSLAELKQAGFKRSGAFICVGGKVALSDKNLPDNSGIYLLVVRGKVRYVGKADRSLRNRLKVHARGLLNGSAKCKVHSGIRETIKSGKSIVIYSMAITKRRRFFKRKGLQVDYLVGLEAGIIEHLDEPHWNPFNSAARARRRKPPVKP
jgi:hypothetical protein